MKNPIDGYFLIDPKSSTHYTQLWASVLGLCYKDKEIESVHFLSWDERLSEELIGKDPLIGIRLFWSIK